MIVKFDDLKHLCSQDTASIVTPEKDPRTSVTFEKRAPAAGTNEGRSLLEETVYTHNVCNKAQI